MDPAQHSTALDEEKKQITRDLGHAGLKESVKSKSEKGEAQPEEESKLDDREIDEEGVEESKLARLNAREVF